MNIIWMLLVLAAIGVAAWPIGVLWDRYVMRSKYGVQILAALLIGGLLWAHVWAVLYVVLDWAGVAVFDLYSVPSYIGWVAVSAWMFERAFVRPEYKHFKELFRRIVAKP
ncbi:amiloride-sensitive sodium channel family protein [Pseudomonas fluorescens]|uniref:Uncharacterized protein n=1 Tax=Pseudomonas fluorescens TaxID=294 RepID=A0A5E7EYW1_PSEFL|nr:amiloride-sensitive sodium channel family protein [Pseudomonas fluorescens]VVO32130.1 hypothetical protein PS691_05027 [Pseudomonas fluorescens]